VLCFNPENMKLYRFSPITDKNILLEAIKHIHHGTHVLCKQSFGHYLPVAGNIGVFCHYEEEFEELVKIRRELTEPSDDLNQKYFRLHESITIPTEEGVPEATYTHLYTRRPDPYRHHVGDVDFYLDPDKYQGLKQSLAEGKKITGARIFGRPDLDMVELYNPDIDVLAYVSIKTMTEAVRKKLSEHTKL